MGCDTGGYTVTGIRCGEGNGSPITTLYGYVGYGFCVWGWRVMDGSIPIGTRRVAPTGIWYAEGDCQNPPTKGGCNLGSPDEGWNKVVKGRNR